MSETRNPCVTACKQNDAENCNTESLCEEIAFCTCRAVKAMKVTRDGRTYTKMVRICISPIGCIMKRERVNRPPNEAAIRGWC